MKRLIVQSAHFIVDVFKAADLFSIPFLGIFWAWGYVMLIDVPTLHGQTIVTLLWGGLFGLVLTFGCALLIYLGDKENKRE